MPVFLLVLVTAPVATPLHVGNFPSVRKRCLQQSADHEGRSGQYEFSTCASKPVRASLPDVVREIGNGNLEHGVLDQSCCA